MQKLLFTTVLMLTFSLSALANNCQERLDTLLENQNTITLLDASIARFEENSELAGRDYAAKKANLSEAKQLMREKKEKLHDIGLAKDSFIEDCLSYN